MENKQTDTIYPLKKPNIKPQLREHNLKKLEKKKKAEKAAEMI